MKSSKFRRNIAQSLFLQREFRSLVGFLSAIMALGFLFGCKLLFLFRGECARDYVINLVLFGLNLLNLLSQLLDRVLVALRLRSLQLLVQRGEELISVLAGLVQPCERFPRDHCCVVLDVGVLQFGIKLALLVRRQLLITTFVEDIDRVLECLRTTTERCVLVKGQLRAFRDARADG